MIDLALIWQKIKLTLSFLKVPKWIYNKVAFFYRLFKFNRLLKDKQEFLIKLYENKIPEEVWFYDSNANLLKCMEIDGYIEIRKKYDYTEAYYNYKLTENYIPVLVYVWRKNQDTFFKNKTINYDDPEFPF